MSNPKEDFDLLVENGNIGFYKTAEVTYIFLVKDGALLNVFTLIVFEESDKISKQDPLTEKLHTINQDMSLGICQERVSINKARFIFTNLIESNKKRSGLCNFGNDPIYVDNFKILSKQFIPSTDNEVPLNNVLKNNNENGSYIIEFFSEEKKLFNEGINENDYKKICKKIREYLPIDFFF